LEVQAQGDLHIDGHHTVEDVGITLGQAVAQAVGDKKGLRRYGHAYVPLDEALSRVVIDFSGRPGLVNHVPFTSGMAQSENIISNGMPALAKVAADSKARKPSASSVIFAGLAPRPFSF
jgi:imidazoleglycerol phosphate dehydratase HisB